MNNTIRYTSFFTEQRDSNAALLITQELRS
jgi:hypothetical protein